MWLVAIFIVLSVAATRMYLIKRCALEICRKVGVDWKVGSLMVPASIMAASFIVDWALYGLAIWIGLTVSWWWAGGLVLAEHVVNAVLPVPYSKCGAMFLRRIDNVPEFAQQKLITGVTDLCGLQSLTGLMR